jgi:outer membrane protein assembly factor BamD (BamD/ComL family)/predicted Ser/Thr protein kinase
VTEHNVIGKTLGNRYRILREVGSGGMAWVYLAEDINEGRLVAIKVLYPQFGEDLAYIQRFNREAKLAGTLSDMHIVRVLDYGATRDVHYLVMEYIEGEDLRSVIDRRGSLPWEEALQLLDQLTVALEHAHLHGVVHRDIKPHNLMITPDGVLKVLDFGIARARMLPSLTQSGFVGSPYYISPEQAMGEEVDIRSDIYSAGVVLYEMLSGRVPYDAASPWSIISQHIASEPPRIDLGGDQIPASTETLLRRMIAKRPEDRFQTPTALREAITCVLEGHPLPETLDIQSPLVPDRLATAEGLYHRAKQAIEEEDWQRAVDLLNQVVKLNPEHAQATAQLAHAGRQARLAALYAAACRAMEGGRWQEVVDELGEVVSVEPNYRNAAELLERARGAQENVDLAQTVSSLYEKGVACVEAGAWEEAARCLRRVQQLSPGYKQTQSLLAEVEHQLRPGPRWLHEMRVALRRIRPALILALALLAIAVGAYFYTQLNSNSDAAKLATRVSDSPTQVYQEAQTAFQAGDWDEAIQLLDALLAERSDYPGASALREQAQVKRAIEQSFREGEAAYSKGSWEEAIDVLSALRGADPGFRTDEVQAMLCDAYLQRGRARVAGYQGASDMTSIEAALQDLKAGLAICPDSQALAAQQRYANTFLLALKAQELKDHTKLIHELTPVVTDEPGYANGNARSMLYNALVARGDIYQQAGNFVGALSDYEQALALGGTDALDATSRRNQVLAKLNSGTPPATPQPGETSVATTYRHAAPMLISPQNEALFQGEFTSVVLQWELVGQLAQDEYYDITVMHYEGDEPRYWGGAVRETQWQVPVEAGFRKAGNDRFHWWVTVRRSNTASGTGELDLAASPPSDTRIFYWGE